MAHRDDVDADLESETRDECARFGTVRRCLVYIMPDASRDPSEAVRIFVQFATFEEAKRAVEAMNKRFFAARQILACLYDEERFLSFDLAAELS